jgi:bifunctional DNase/RNase
LICVRDKIEEIIDARTSDAVALSIRFNTPIFTYENILKKAGFTNDNSDQGEGKNDDQWIKNFIKEQTLSDKDKDLSNITLKDLKALLKKFVKEEDYESAAKVRDELSSRKKDK